MTWQPSRRRCAERCRCFRTHGPFSYLLGFRGLIHSRGSSLQAQIEIEAAQGETTKVRKKAAAQRELLAKQSDQIKDLTFQLQEMKRMQSQEEKAGAKKLTSHEKRAAALHHRLGELSHEHEQAMSAASAAMNDLQAERDALAMALAAVAKQAVRL